MMKKSHLVLLVVNLILILGFGIFFFLKMNYEFVIYVGVIIFVMGLIGVSMRKVNYTTGTLVGLTVWSALHLAGGGIKVGDGRLYDVILIPLSKEYPIWRYDQLVHIWGFGAATLVMYCLLSRILVRPREHPVALGLALVMAGMGMGAFNEVLEFLVSICVAESGVGGYINTSLDLCSNLIGAALALIFIRWRYMRPDTV